MWHWDIKMPWHNSFISLFSLILGSSPSQLIGIYWAQSCTGDLQSGPSDHMEPHPYQTERSTNPSPVWLCSCWHSSGHSWLFLQGMVMEMPPWGFVLRHFSLTSSLLIARATEKHISADVILGSPRGNHVSAPHLKLPLSVTLVWPR